MEKKKSTKAAAKPTTAAADKANTDKVKADQIKADKVKADQIKADKVKADQIKADKVKADQIKADKVKADQIKADKVKADQIKADKVKADKKEPVEKALTKNRLAWWGWVLIVLVLLGLSFGFGRLWDHRYVLPPAPVVIQPTAEPIIVPPATSEPTAIAATATSEPVNGVPIEGLKWSELFPMDNLVIPGAIQIRPDADFDVHIESVEVGTTYQLKTDFDDTDLNTWKDGVRLYEYRIPPGYQPLFIGVQGDTGLTLCWEAEANGGEYTQILLKTEKGNGTSALVQFIEVPLENQPQVHQFCQ